MYLRNDHFVLFVNEISFINAAPIFKRYSPTCSSASLSLKTSLSSLTFIPSTRNITILHSITRPYLRKFFKNLKQYTTTCK